MVSGGFLSGRYLSGRFLSGRFVSRTVLIRTVRLQDSSYPDGSYPCTFIGLISENNKRKNGEINCGNDFNAFELKCIEFVKNLLKRLTS